MLGRLQMSTEECIDAYLRLSKRVFQKKRHMVTVKGKIQGRFDSNELELAVKEVLTNQGLSQDTLLKEATNAACKVQVDLNSYLFSTLCITDDQQFRVRDE
jgi:hypothetical protein